jgi:hypothetical protein
MTGSHPHRVTNTKCRIDTVISPDDGHIVAQNMYRKEINILRKIVYQSRFYLQDYTGMYSQQNLKKWKFKHFVNSNKKSQKLSKKSFSYSTVCMT